MLSEQPYQPISCADHERLEFAALTRQWLGVNVKAGDPPGRQRVIAAGRVYA